MKDANARTGRQQSRLTKLHRLVLRANLTLGTFYHLFLTTLSWLFQAFRWFYLTILERISVVGGFVAILYLAWDSLYQTTLSVGMVYSDAATALQNPIALQNKSNLFTIKNIHWVCLLNNVRFEGLVVNGTKINPNPQYANAIEPGRILNVACNRTLDNVGPFQGLPKLISGNIYLEINYDAEFFGIWTYHRTLITPFTWVNDIPQPQWVQGDFAR